MAHDHSSPVIESQGHRSRSKVNARLCVLHEYLLRRTVGKSLIDGRSSRITLLCRHRLDRAETFCFCQVYSTCRIA